jgi:hypothetical protein
MSEPRSTPARPVSLVTIFAIAACFALFLFLVWLAYVPRPLQQGINLVAEQLPADQAWQATPEARLAYLQALRAKQAQQLQSYGWVDQKAGVVQLPIDRAMELVAQQYGSNSAARP